MQQLRNVSNRRLKVLEKQAATFGSYAPPYILTELEDVRQEITRIEARLQARPSILSSQIRHRARAAYFQKQWEQAIELFEQVIIANPFDDDSTAKLVEAQKQYQLLEDYGAIQELCYVQK